MSPVVFEAVRAQLSPEDGVLLACMNLGGLRPQEVFGLTPESINENTLAVLSAVAFGAAKATKTSKQRYPPLYGVLAELLRPHAATIAPGAPLWPDPVTGSWMADHNWRNWRNRTFAGALLRAHGTLSPIDQARYADLTERRPYDIGRHSYAALRLRAGGWRNLGQLAQDLGHTTQTLQAEYGGLLAEYTGSAVVDFETEVRAARQS